jgi:hypothetical protein
MWWLQIILASIAIILFIILIILKSKNKARQNKESQEAYAKIRGKKVRIETAQESLESLNRLAKDFFKNYLKLKNELTYQEISEILRNKKDISLADFCDRINYYLYSGKPITKQESIALINQFIVLTKSKKFK